MCFRQFFRRKIHNQQHLLDMNKKSQNGYKANTLHPKNCGPQNNKHVTPCKNISPCLLDV